MSHFGTQRRLEFRTWVDAGMPPQAAVQVYYETVKWPAAKMLGAMTRCTDTMPDELCDTLKAAHGTSYATAAARLMRAAAPAS